MQKHLAILTCLLLTACTAKQTAPSATIAPAHVDHSPTIQQLIQDLANDDFAKRQRADDLLFAIGAPAIPALQQAALDADTERALRAQKLIDRIDFARVCPQKIEAWLTASFASTERDALEAWITTNLQEAIPYLLEKIAPPEPGASTHGPYTLVFRAWRRSLLTDAQKSLFIRKAYTVAWEHPPEEKSRLNLVVNGTANTQSAFSPREREAMPWDFLEPHYYVELDGKPLKDGETHSGVTTYIFIPDNLAPGEHTLNVNLEFREKNGKWSTTLRAETKFRPDNTP